MFLRFVINVLLIFAVFMVGLFFRWPMPWVLLSAFGIGVLHRLYLHRKITEREESKKKESGDYDQY